MTLDELAQMTQRGFLGVDERFANIEKQLKNFATKKDLQETEEHLLDAIKGIEVKRHDFDALKSEVGDLSQRIVGIEKKI